MYTTTTPATAKNSGPSETGALFASLRATTAATAVEEAEEEDVGMAGTRAKGGVSSLVNTIGRSSLVTPPGVTSLVRVALRETEACLRCHHRQGGTTMTARETGHGGSRNHVQLHAFWEEPMPRRPTASSSSLPVR